MLWRPVQIPNKVRAFTLVGISLCDGHRRDDGMRFEASWNVMAHAQKPDFVFRRKWRVHLNRWGRQFSRLLAAEVCASAVVMLDTPCSVVVWRVLVTHSIRQFPLHSSPTRGGTVCHHISTGVYLQLGTQRRATKFYMVWWCLLFVGPQYGTSLMWPWWRLQFRCGF